jgi:putative transposase
MGQEGQAQKVYLSDLTDEQWAIVELLIPPAKQSPRGGRQREVDMREVLNTIFYLNRSGCQWDMLPHDLLPKNTVYDYFAQWRDDGTWAKMVKALRERTRVAAGRELTSSAACIDSQSVKTTELGGPERGYDGGKKIKGRKRHLFVDTLGVLIAILITSASLDDGVAAPLLLGHVQAYNFPRLITIFADTKYRNHTLEAWMAVHRSGWHLEVKTRPAWAPRLVDGDHAMKHAAEVQGVPPRSARVPCGRGQQALEALPLLITPICGIGVDGAQRSNSLP